MNSDRSHVPGTEVTSTSKDLAVELRIAGRQDMR